MASISPISKVGNVEYFAVLPTGFYLFLVGYFVFYFDYPNLNNTQTLWVNLFPLAQQVKEYPLLLVFILFASYLLGSIIRSFPVYWVERLIPPFTREFPYPKRLKEILDTLNCNCKATLDSHKTILEKMGTPPKVPMILYNYWKDVLCIYAPQSFLYYERFEARSRFFAGMFWAGLIGTAGSIWILVNIHSVSFKPALHLLTLSIAILLSFGINFRRIRKQEADALLTCFIAFLQGNHVKGKDGSHS